MNKQLKKYSLWELVHESEYIVTAYKVKDTNSSNEVDEWIAADWYNAASFYRIETEINSNYIQFINQ